MRQAQQNRRGRGRNRKGQNPLTRTYESNGPDVKIRGTPSHIAEKYVSMARDALSSGDPVLAENYLQHAEHYNRIIMSHREQQMAEENRAGGRPKGGQDDDAGEDSDGNGGERQQARGQEQQPQPQPQGKSNRGEGKDDTRPSRRQRSRGDDNERGDGNGRVNGRGGRRPRYVENDDQPDFLKRPVRRPSNDDGDDAGDTSMEADQAVE
jgi:hypothetical protein